VFESAVKISYLIEAVERLHIVVGTGTPVRLGY
jgi:hypothetical protein